MVIQCCIQTEQIKPRLTTMIMTILRSKGQSSRSRRLTSRSRRVLCYLRTVNRRRTSCNVAMMNGRQCLSSRSGSRPPDTTWTHAASLNTRYSRYTGNKVRWSAYQTVPSSLGSTFIASHTSTCYQFSDVQSFFLPPTRHGDKKQEVKVI